MSKQRKKIKEEPFLFDGKEVIVSKDAKNQLNCNYNTLYYYVRSGSLTKIRSKSGRYYFYKDEIENFIFIETPEINEEKINKE